MRPVRTFGATVALVAAMVALWYAGQDLRGYWENLSAGYTQWAVTAQGWLKLASGIAEAAATVGLLILTSRLLGTKFMRTLAKPARDRLTSEGDARRASFGAPF
jgi:hypothetical protein